MDLAKQYREMHENQKRFPGYSIIPYVDRIAELVAEYKPERLLDFGCGKGFQYLELRVHEKWGGLLPHCYDPGIRQLSELPEGQFGGVICTDVLEHIEEADLPRVLDQLYSKTQPDGFLFIVVSCRPSRKTLPRGGDVHVTIKPPSWWKDLLCREWNDQRPGPRLVVYWDVEGHFDEPDTPWDSGWW